MKGISLAVVIPAHNEASRIAPTLDSIIAFGREWEAPFEVVVVDDGSTDGTAALVRERFGSSVGLVERSARGGKGRALRDGVAAATADWVVFVDADHAIRIEQVESFMPHTERYPVIIGSKREPGARAGIPVLRRLAGGVGQALIQLFAVGGFSDTQCGFKLLRRDVAQELFEHQRITAFGYDFELLYLAQRFGYEVLELPVECEDLGGGSVRVSSYLLTLLELARFFALRLLGRYPSPRVKSPR